VLDMPAGTFQGAGVKTVVLFFEKGAPTREVFYYQLDPGRSLGKTTALNDADFADFVAKAKGRVTGNQSWMADAAEVDPITFDLSARNPHAPEAEAIRAPHDILDEIRTLDAKSTEILNRVRELV
jgi:type I restriction enzyme M protein